MAAFLGFSVTGSFCVEFTVRDPQGASAKDTLSVEIIQSGIEVRQIAEAPKAYTLYGNYPNPFNPVTTIRYGLPKPSRVRLRVFDVQGRETEILVDRRQPPGVYEARWDASGRASGVYLVVIETEGWKQVRRMMLVK